MDPKAVKEYVNRRIAKLLKMPDAKVKATLARLRRAAGGDLKDHPQVWGDILSDMPDEMYGISGEPTREEWSVYIALTCFALHQQGKDIKRSLMNASEEEISIGEAVAKLANEENKRERIIRRFNRVITADDIFEVSVHIRALISLLRNEEISLNYGILAMDLCLFQSDANKARIKLKWGQDFYKNTYNNKEEGE